MGKPALDYHVCHRGFYAGVEAKAPGEHMTDRQVRTAYEIIKAGGAMFCIDGETCIDFEELRSWLRQPFHGAAGANWIHESDLYKQRMAK